LIVLFCFLGEWYATPLLTMTDEDEKAMKNKIFRRLIRKIGLKPPADFNVVRIHPCHLVFSGRIFSLVLFGTVNAF